ncbi:hypothetical protein HN803_02850, partial [candidate division WWE3 bacterium]|nr:hypothetical protein [candidate division WWE3 bacterium]
MGVEFLKPNFTAGELAPTLHSRTDISKYQNGVANAENMIILPHGGLRRRPGLATVEDTKVDSKARMIPFVFNTEQKYLILLRNLIIDIYRDGVLVSTEVSTYTEDEIFDVDVVQSADTMIFAHQNSKPYRLQRQGSDTLWDFSAIVFDYEPKETDGITDAWSATKGYPRCCTFFGGRLWLGGSTEYPTTIWGSKINGFFDFDLGEGEDDFALADVLDTDQYNPITNIFAGRDLQVFTTGGELYNTASPITPASSAWKRQTGYGSSRVNPIIIDGA